MEYFGGNKKERIESQKLDQAVIGAILALGEGTMSTRDFSKTILHRYLIENVNPIILIRSFEELRETMYRFSSIGDLKHWAEFYIKEAFDYDEQRIEWEKKFQEALLRVNEEYEKVLKDDSTTNLSDTYKSLKWEADAYRDNMNDVRIKAVIASAKDQIIERLLIPYFDYFKK